jgi:hypothetical protein
MIFYAAARGLLKDLKKEMTQADIDLLMSELAERLEGK